MARANRPLQKRSFDFMIPLIRKADNSPNKSCMIQFYEFLGHVASRSVVDDIKKVAEAGEALNKEVDLDTLEK